MNGDVLGIDNLKHIDELPQPEHPRIAGNGFYNDQIGSGLFL